MATRKPIRANLLRASAAMVLLGCAAAAATSAAGQPVHLEGPAQVLDGRTLAVAGRAIRLAGIDGPDPEQTCRWNGRTIPCGLIAGDALRDLVTGANVRCTVTSQTGHQLVGTCIADGFDIGGNMVHTGWAVTAPDGPGRYRETEAEAKAARRGLWRGQFVMPADWRTGTRLP